MSLQDKASIIWPKGAPSKAGFVAAWNPQAQALVNFPIVRATEKTYLASDGLLKTAAANVLPRDFTNGGCGDWAIEPQRSNYIQFGNLLTGWTAQAGTSITTGQADMMGGTNAVRLQSNGTAAIFRDIDDLGFPDNVEGTISCWVKATSSTSEPFRFVADGTQNSPNLTATNEWQKFSFTFTNGVGPNNSGFIYDTSGNPFDIIIFLPQMEVGAYPTSSIINFTGSAVTRNADVPALTGASALLGDSAGGVFIDFLKFDNLSGGLSLSDGTNNTRLVLDIAFTAGLFVAKSGATQVNGPFSGTITKNVFNKIAFRYAINDFNLFLNGSSIAVDTSGDTFDEGSLNTVKLARNPTAAVDFYGRIRQFIVFNQAPNNTQLAAITTP